MRTAGLRRITTPMSESRDWTGTPVAVATRQTAVLKTGMKNRLHMRTKSIWSMIFAHVHCFGLDFRLGLRLGRCLGIRSRSGVRVQG